jgi:hypothetical protein
VTALSIFNPVCARAQSQIGAAALPPQHNCSTGNGWKVKGQIFGTTGLPIARQHFANIKGSVWCAILSDDHGKFEFSNMPAGTYDVHVGGLGYRDEKISVKVPDSSTVVVFHLRPENAVADCEETPACAAILRGSAAAVAKLSKAQRRAEVIFRTAIALTGELDWIPCPATTDAMVLAALHNEIPAVTPASECEMSAPNGTRKLVYTTNTHARAYFVSLDSLSEGEAAFQANLSFNAGERWGRGWRCTFTMSNGFWQATTCKGTWVS